MSVRPNNIREVVQSMDGEFSLSLVPVGKNGSATITARLNGEVLEIEKVDLAKTKQRKAFADLVCKDRKGLDWKVIEGLLLKEADNLSNRTLPADPTPSEEVDTNRIIRPERFIRPEVSGLAVPTMASSGDKVQGQWEAYIRWSDGRRERRQLGTALDVAGRDRLYIHPIPGEPAPDRKPGWTAASRQKWLAGEPAPKPVDTFMRICETIDHFLDLPGKSAQGTTATIALWVFLTYCYHAWSALPYLYIGGPLGSGKSRVFEILDRLCFRPLATSNLTAALLFRNVHSFGGTIILDEAERLKKTKDPDVAELLSLLLAGYKAGSRAHRMEPIGDSYRPVAFDVFGPKALACIAGLPPALASRSIGITMFRSSPRSDKPRRRIDANPERWANLRDQLHIIALEHGPRFLELADLVDVCPAMSGRNFEIWQPILSLASWLDDLGATGLLEVMRAHTKTVIEAGVDDQVPDHDETLLRLLTECVRKLERPTPGDLLDRAREIEPETFKRWSAKGIAEQHAVLSQKLRGHYAYYGITGNSCSLSRLA